MTASGTVREGPIYFDHDALLGMIWERLKPLAVRELQVGGEERDLYATVEVPSVGSFVMARLLGGALYQPQDIEVAVRGSWVKIRHAKHDQVQRLAFSGEWKVLHPLELLAHRIG